MLVKKKKGVTLIELLISITILSFIIGISYNLFENNIKLFNQKSQQVNSENDIRILTDWLTKDLKNTNPDNVKKDEAGNYTIGTVKYTALKAGNIGTRKVFKLERQSSQDGNMELVNSIAEGKNGFNIEVPSQKEPYYKVSVTIIDKFNKDKNIEFKVSYLSGKVAVNDDNKEPIEQGSPFIDLNDNGKFDGKDYRITFDKRGVYDSNNDKKYKANCKLVFEENFKTEGGNINAFIVSGGVRLKDNVELNASGNGEIYINTSKIVFDSGSSMNTDGNGKLNILYDWFPKELASNPQKLQAAFVIYNPTFEAHNNGVINIEGSSVKITPEFQPNPFPPNDLSNTKIRISKIRVEENGNINIRASSLAISWALCLTDGKKSSINISGGAVDTSTVNVHGDGNVIVNGTNIIK